MTTDTVDNTVLNMSAETQGLPYTNLYKQVNDMKQLIKIRKKQLIETNELTAF